MRISTPLGLVSKVPFIALNKGFYGADAYLEKSIKKEFLNLKSNYLKIKKESSLSRLSVRLFKKKGQPFCLSYSAPSIEYIKKEINKYCNLKIETNCNNFFSLLPKENYPQKLFVLYYPEIKKYNFKYFNGIMEQIKNKTEKIGLLINESSLTVIEKKRYLANSNRFKQKLRKSIVELNIFFIDKKTNKPIKKKYKALSMNDFDIDNFIEELEEKQLFLKPKKDMISPKNSPVIFAPQAISFIINNLKLQFISDLQKKKITQSLPNFINLSDFPYIENKIGSEAIDDEGILCQETKIIEKGIPLNRINNLRSAYKFNEMPTGNGFRIGDPSLTLSSKFTNLVLKPNDFKRSKLFEDANQGLFVKEIIQSKNIAERIIFQAICCKFQGKNLLVPMELKINCNLESLLLRSRMLSNSCDFDYFNCNIGAPYLLTEPVSIKNGEILY